MADGLYRIGIVGATSLVGKELSDELQESLLAASDFVLLDDEEEATGVVASVGDEAAFVQRIDSGSFDRMDFVFFAGNAASTLKHWPAAKKAGVSSIDLTYALEQETGVPVRAPFVADAMKKRAEGQPTLETASVVSAHPAAVMLAAVAARLQAGLAVESFAAVVMEPASQYGREAMDELHQQTVNLLSFKDLPKEQYDAQVAFNLLPSLGEDAKVKLAESENRIRRHYGAIGGLPTLEVQLIQAPVFHGYVASVLVELKAEATAAEVETALMGESIDVVTDESDPPSNLSAAGQEDIMVRVRGAAGVGVRSRRFWLWMAVDNLKLTALNAISCANELRRLRPSGKVQ
ncbi:Asd/ArgC dimerization domain-containing protein [Granulicella tundricola]|uniref:Semialdehyde dehydrogenase NAD-binding protein n=1 Tax=Granulicella tundricola (strain ATCC BAA-1859 / DSM 23138 / MP5ACTX9) TaxID=1198114 RepID=E8X4B3_GRATM|nr:Asd/ArgC dimerization domain-containing protein [Granulicella tundricola]ADW68240.1 Semialdehyde dehydrogenase NAD - binding protein [Granulicella tundricola MP5ACTX9]